MPPNFRRSSVTHFSHILRVLARFFWLFMLQKEKTKGNSTIKKGLHSSKPF